MVTVVADREADIYPMWARVPQAGFHLLSRAMNDRLLAGGGTLFSAAVQFPVSARRTIDLPARQPAHAGRTAAVELRFGEVEICRPRDERDRSLPQTVRLRLVEVRETAWLGSTGEPCPPDTEARQPAPTRRRRKSSASAKQRRPASRTSKPHYRPAIFTRLFGASNRPKLPPARCTNAISSGSLAGGRSRMPERIALPPDQFSGTGQGR